MSVFVKVYTKQYTGEVVPIATSQHEWTLIAFVFTVLTSPRLKTMREGSDWQ